MVTNYGRTQNTSFSHISSNTRFNIIVANCFNIHYYDQAALCALYSPSLPLPSPSLNLKCIHTSVHTVAMALESQTTSERLGLHGNGRPHMTSLLQCILNCLAYLTKCTKRAGSYLAERERWAQKTCTHHQDELRLEHTGLHQSG